MIDVRDNKLTQKNDSSTEVSWPGGSKSYTKKVLKVIISTSLLSILLDKIILYLSKLNCLRNTLMISTIVTNLLEMFY